MIKKSASCIMQVTYLGKSNVKADFYSKIEKHSGTEE